MTYNKPLSDDEVARLRMCYERGDSHDVAENRVGVSLYRLRKQFALFEEAGIARGMLRFGRKPYHGPTMIGKAIP